MKDHHPPPSTKGIWVILLTFLFFWIWHMWTGYGIQIPKDPTEILLALRLTNGQIRQWKKRKTKVETQMLLHNALDLSVYKEDNGCDFSEIVRNFEPNGLPLRCDNVQKELQEGKLLGIRQTIYTPRYLLLTFL